MTLYIGIDPGLTGAVAFLSDSGKIWIHDAPIAKIGKNTAFSVSEMVEFFEATDCDCMAAIEAVHSMPKQGVKSVFSFGKGVGLWIGILATLRIPYEEVTPQRWQGVMLDGMQKEKDSSRIKAMQMYPNLTEQLKLKKHHGRADALLIATWLRRREAGK